MIEDRSSELEKVSVGFADLNERMKINWKKKKRISGICRTIAV